MKNLTLLLLILISLASCGTKQKALQKEKEKTELKTETEVKNETSSETKMDSIVDTKKTEITTETETELNIVADSTGVVTVETEKTEKGTKQTFTGVKTISVRDKSIEQKKVDSTRLRWQKTVKDTASYYEQTILELEQDKKSILDVKEIDNRNMFWVWGFWILIICIVLYIIYKNRRFVRGFVIIGVLLFSYSANAQGIKFTFTQDAKLATMKDDHGNTPWTWNTTTKVHFQEYQKGIGFPTVGVKFEYADLDSGSFYRYGAELGYCIQLVPVKDGFDDRSLVSVTPLVGYGVSKRSFTNAFSSLEGSLEVGVNVTKRLQIVTLNNYTQREGFWRYSFHVGVGYQFL